MRATAKIFAIIAAGVAAAAWAFAAGAGDTSDSADDEGKEVAYVEREEKVVNFVTGKVEKQRVIEFPELEIFPELARPVSIIIPRHKPDFEHIPFTIYNNEPPSYVPEQYRREYYRRLAPTRDVNAAEMFRPGRDADRRDASSAEDNAAAEDDGAAEGESSDNGDGDGN